MVLGYIPSRRHSPKTPGNKSLRSPIQSHAANCRETGHEHRRSRERPQPPQGAGMHDLGGNRRVLDYCRRRATSLGIIDGALAQQSKGFTFLQISDSHMGFDKPANPNVKGTLEEAIGRVKALAGETILHDPYRRHLASVEAGGVRRRRTASSREARLDVHYVPGEHDSSMTTRANSTASAMAAAPRAQAGTASMPTACTSSAWSTS